MFHTVKAVAVRTQRRRRSNHRGAYVKPGRWSELVRKENLDSQNYVTRFIHLMRTNFHFRCNLKWFLCFCLFLLFDAHCSCLFRFSHLHSPLLRRHLFSSSSRASSHGSLVADWGAHDFSQSFCKSWCGTWSTRDMGSTKISCGRGCTIGAADKAAQESKNIKLHIAALAYVVKSCAITWSSLLHYLIFAYAPHTDQVFARAFTQQTWLCGRDYRSVGEHCVVVEASRCY